LVRERRNKKRQRKVLGAIIHETQGLVEQIIALPHAQCQGDVENYNRYVPLGKPTKNKTRRTKKGTRIQITSFSEWLANGKTLRTKKGARIEMASFSELLANRKRCAQRKAWALCKKKIK